jgi:2-oxoglutarate ferredoxin oxidoreductase subunit alpha
MNAPQKAEVRESVVIRFAGDSGDGMQLTGSRFTETSALAGNDIATLPDYPAEIRAPAGSLGGVSGFQIQFSSEQIFTPGDRPDVLVAMNPAALKRNIGDLEPGAIIIADEDEFKRKNLMRAEWDENPLDEESDALDGYRVIKAQITKMTVEALDDVEDIGRRDKKRCKNFFALGLTYHMFDRDLSATQEWIENKFGADTAIGKANLIALQKGYDYGVTVEAIAHKVEVPAATIEPGLYRSITGNQATAYGFTTAAHLAKRPLVQATYPITPASDILHELSKLKNYNVMTIQAEDEIAAVSMAIGAAYGGSIGLTSSSGPGIALKGEAIGLATGVELPLVVIDVQRAGPSTGMPTKTEQADLMQAIHGRHGESPLVVVAPAHPSDCFQMAIEAVRLATKYMTPVIFLSDGYIANSAEPWQIPNIDELDSIEVKAPAADPSGKKFLPFARDPDTLARQWAVPGIKGLEHRIGGLEKEEDTGNISYNPENHQKMTDIRQAKIDRIASDVPQVEVDGAQEGDVLMVGWGSTWGAIRTAVNRANRNGRAVGHAHLRYLNPLPQNLGEVLDRFDKILIPELNGGQLAYHLRAKFDADIVSFPKVEGLPFRVSELEEKLNSL